ncbi:hypothetical protein NIE88_19005 [Sporolactobacillus shoreicorticis]|uniref:Uncharacterized protein n=1 Tax=Sporolactobacillus shoreicorticis TaxID=1923877 RepID=A0ABW5S5X3_9BACL|nr:hypothetical protein [Sporolactobacillus shoreicorticis]MCO7127840.1 hypothetical protein [Sporolactobacillus shoreicorticis]
MKNVMSRAWEIAKEGQKKFGGKASQYFAMALKMAWKKAKEGNKVVSIAQIISELNEYSTYTAREWKNYGKHRIYLQSFTRGGAKRSNDGFFEVVNGVIAGKSSVMRNGGRKVFYKFEGYKLA